MFVDGLGAVPGQGVEREGGLGAASLATSGGIGRADAKSIRALLGNSQDVELYRKLTEEMSYDDYLNRVAENPNIARNAFQRVYDMIMYFERGQEPLYLEEGPRGEKIRRYRLFDDPINNGKDAIFGIDRSLNDLVRHLESAAKGYGTEERVLLLHGPVGSSKSTIARLLKRGLEHYSKTDEGALYELGFIDPEDQEGKRVCWSPMHEEPLLALPMKYRSAVFAQINAEGSNGRWPLKLKKDLTPFADHYFKEWMARCEGDINGVLDKIRVKRVIISEKDRVGIGTFQPKDEKNQDSTELTGDVNYRKIAQYGSESDPRAFNFDGEFNVANRGVVEFIEVLKLDVAFLYDLLGASQEQQIKPKRFQLTDIDEVILGHTNEPEYQKLKNNKFMEALRDRTVKVDVPYVTKLDDEQKIYEKKFAPERIGIHIAPHTIEMAAMWAILTRLEDPKDARLTRIQKLKLYNGKTLPGYTQENIRDLKQSSEREGMEGISPRYVGDKISNAIVTHGEGRYVNPFMVFNELDSGLDNHSLINDPETKKSYRDQLGEVKKEYENIVKKEVQMAIACDEDALKRLCGNYIDNVKAYTQREKVKNAYTQQYQDPDERLMRSIEEKIDIPENRKDDFRREVMNYIAALSLEGRQFNFRANERLLHALQLKLFEDQKDTIKLSSLMAKTVDAETQQKIDIVKARLIKNFGYTDDSATDVLNYVASIFARGDAKK